MKKQLTKKEVLGLFIVLGGMVLFLFLRGMVFSSYNSLLVRESIVLTSILVIIIGLGIEKNKYSIFAVLFFILAAAIAFKNSSIQLDSEWIVAKFILLVASIFFFYFSYKYKKREDKKKKLSFLMQNKEFSSQGDE
jgi:hypothetical protein